MRLLKFAIAVMILLSISLLIIFVVHKFNTKSEKWKIEIVNSYINVRQEPDTLSSMLTKVKQGEKYEVLDIYLEDSEYVWYKIECRGKEGWVASPRNE